MGCCASQNCDGDAYSHHSGGRRQAYGSNSPGDDEITGASASVGDLLPPPGDPSGYEMDDPPPLLLVDSDGFYRSPTTATRRPPGDDDDDARGLETPAGSSMRPLHPDSPTGAGLSLSPKHQRHPRTPQRPADGADDSGEDAQGSPLRRHSSSLRRQPPPPPQQQQQTTIGGSPVQRTILPVTLEELFKANENAPQVSSKVKQARCRERVGRWLLHVVIPERVYDARSLLLPPVIPEGWEAPHPWTLPEAVVTANLLQCSTGGPSGTYDNVASENVSPSGHPLRRPSTDGEQTTLHATSSLNATSGHMSPDTAQHDSLPTTSKNAAGRDQTPRHGLSLATPGSGVFEHSSPESPPLDASLLVPLVSSPVKDADATDDLPLGATAGGVEHDGYTPPTAFAATPMSQPMSHTNSMRRYMRTSQSQDDSENIPGRVAAVDDSPGRRADSPSPMHHANSMPNMLLHSTASSGSAPAPAAFPSTNLLRAASLGTMSRRRGTSFRSQASFSSHRSAITTAGSSEPGSSSDAMQPHPSGTSPPHATVGSSAGHGSATSSPAQGPLADAPSAPFSLAGQGSSEFAAGVELSSRDTSPATNGVVPPPIAVFPMHAELDPPILTITPTTTPQNATAGSQSPAHATPSDPAAITMRSLRRRSKVLPEEVNDVPTDDGLLDFFAPPPMAAVSGAPGGASGSIPTTPSGTVQQGMSMSQSAVLPTLPVVPAVPATSVANSTPAGGSSSGAASIQAVAGGSPGLLMPPQLLYTQHAPPPAPGSTSPSHRASGGGGRSVALLPAPMAEGSAGAMTPTSPHHQTSSAYTTASSTPYSSVLPDDHIDGAGTAHTRDASTASGPLGAGSAVRSASSPAAHDPAPTSTADHQLPGAVWSMRDSN